MVAETPASGNHEVSRFESHFRHHLLGNHFSVFKGEADQAGTARVVPGHDRCKSQVLKAAQHVPFVSAALRPDFVLFLPDHGEFAETELCQMCGVERRLPTDTGACTSSVLSTEYLVIS